MKRRTSHAGEARSRTLKPQMSTDEHGSPERQISSVFICAHLWFTSVRKTSREVFSVVADHERGAEAVRRSVGRSWTAAPDRAGWRNVAALTRRATKGKAF